VVTASTKWAGVYKAAATPAKSDGSPFLPISSPKRELRIFTPDGGGAEHIGPDHLPHVSAFIADWVTDTFAELPSPGC
jgi:hypothetical protein